MKRVITKGVVFILFLLVLPASAQPYRQINEWQKLISHLLNAGFQDFRSSCFEHLNKRGKEFPIYKLPCQKPADNSSLPQTAIIDDSIKYTYLYNDNDLLQTELNQVWLNNNWNNFEKITYSYDKSRNKINTLHEEWIENTWTGTERYLFTYDQFGNCLVTRWEQWYNNKWNISSLDSSAYDENNRLCLNLRQFWDDGLLIYGTRDTYTFSENSDSYTHEIWTDNQWRVDLRRRTQNFVYPDSTCTINIYDKSEDNGWVNLSRMTWSHNSERLVWVIEGWENNNWVNFERQTFKSLYRYFYYWLDEKWDGGNWVNIERKTETYDLYKSVTLVEKWENNKWENAKRTVTQFNEDYNILTDVSEVWDLSNWVNSEKHLYKYDIFGNAIYGEYSKYENSNWTNSKGFLLLFYNRNQNFFDRTAHVINISYNVITGITSNQTGNKFYLNQNYPNPFNPTTTIKYYIPHESKVTLVVYNSIGQTIRELVNETLPEGVYSVKFNGQGLPSGVYFYVMNAGGFQQVKKLLLLK